MTSRFFERKSPRRGSVARLVPRLRSCWQFHPWTRMRSQYYSVYRRRVGGRIVQPEVASVYLKEDVVLAKFSIVVEAAWHVCREPNHVCCNPRCSGPLTAVSSGVPPGVFQSGASSFLTREPKSPAVEDVSPL